MGAISKELANLQQALEDIKGTIMGGGDGVTRQVLEHPTSFWKGAFLIAPATHQK